MEARDIDGLDVAKAARSYLQAQAELTRQQQAARSRRGQRMLQALNQSGPAALSVGTALVVVLLIGFLAAVAVSAALEKGLVVEAFAVPQRQASLGVTGQVLASQFLDRIVFMRDHTIRPQKDRAKVVPPENPIKVQISSATISFDEIYTYLRVWLGHETFISGELLVVPGGTRRQPVMILSARADNGGYACSSKGTAIEYLIADVAGCVYRSLEPYRYAAFIAAQCPGDQAKNPRSRALCLGNHTKAVEIYREIIATSTNDDRAWAFEGLGYRVQTDGSDPNGSRISGAAKYVMAIQFYRNAIFGADGIHGLDNFTYAYRDLVDAESTLGRDGDADDHTRRLLQLTRRVDGNDSGGAARFNDEYTARLDEDAGDFQAAQALHGKLAASSSDPGDRDTAFSDAVENLANLHDPAAAAQIAHLKADARLEVDVSLERWSDAAAAGPAALAHCRDEADCLPDASVAPSLAQALAALDRIDHRGFADARLILDKTPADCYSCLRVRAQLAALEGDGRQADALFGAAVRLAPRLPAAYEEWAVSLLERGQTDEALDKLQQAHVLGPHFADALEAWGEALIAKNRSDLALAKFQEAARYAPNWGRLHLKWGEALGWTGDRTGARLQFIAAARLDLSPSDRTVLKRLLTAG
jgi:tetratricopeptide (TPR) repeat protein